MMCKLRKKLCTLGVLKFRAPIVAFRDSIVIFRISLFKRLFIFLSSIKLISGIFTIILFSAMDLEAALPTVRIETKAFSSDVVFIFYHDKSQLLDINNKGNNVFVRLNIPSEFALSNMGAFNKYAKNLNFSSNKQSLNFTVTNDLQYVSLVNGEQFDAVKFRSISQIQKEDLTVLSAAHNDPGAIRYEQKGEDHSLVFNIGNETSKASVFFRGRYLWIVFDQQKVFSFKSNGGIFSDFESVPSSTGTVLRLKVADGYSSARLAKIKSGWVVNVSKRKYRSNDKNNFITESSSNANEDGVKIRGKFSDKFYITFQDPEVGDVVKVIAVDNVGSRVAEKKDSIDFVVLESVQGIAVALYNDDVKVEKSDEEIKIVSDASLPDEMSMGANNFPESIEQYLKLPSILPYLDKNLNILNFNQQKSRLVSEASESQNDDEKYLKNLELAKFFFVHEWYSESLDAVNLAKKASPLRYQNDLQARFLMAVDYTLAGDSTSAKNEYDALLKFDDVGQIPEVVLWSKYNSFLAAVNPGAIGFLENIKAINYYSNDKYWPILLAEIELALGANDLKMVEKLLREHREADAGSKYANSIKFYQAEYYRKRNQFNLAKQFYRELVNDETDPFNTARASFNLVKLRLKEQEIGLPDAIRTLEELRFQWRGDRLEYEILMELAGYYKDNNDIMSSLRIYQYIQTAFNNKISNFYITSEMARIFNEVFLPGGLAETMDDFSAVALFYEFKELNPIGEQGDDVILSIAKRLVKLDLLENAADLLRHQIKYRLQGEKRVINADNLAVVLLMDKKPNESMLILDDTDKDNFNFNEHQYRTRLRAKALIDLEKYPDAIEYLKDDDSTDAEIIIREALFQGKNWSGYVERVGSAPEQLAEKLDQKDPAAVQDILRLAISYYLLGRQEDLSKLISTAGNRDEELKNTLALLVTSGGTVDYKNLDKSLNIDQMKTLLDKYKNQFLGSSS